MANGHWILRILSIIAVLMDLLVIKIRFFSIYLIKNFRNRKKENLKSFILSQNGVVNSWDVFLGHLLRHFERIYKFNILNQFINYVNQSMVYWPINCTKTGIYLKASKYVIHQLMSVFSPRLRSLLSYMIFITREFFLQKIEWPLDDCIVHLLDI